MTVIVQTGNATHDAKVVKQAAIAQAVIVASASQPTINSAEVTFYKAAAQSAVANGLSAGHFLEALHALGHDLYA
jgi:predicted alpha/beta hydrolase family esterase